MNNGNNNLPLDPVNFQRQGLLLGKLIDRKEQYVQVVEDDDQNIFEVTTGRRIPIELGLEIFWVGSKEENITAQEFNSRQVVPHFDSENDLKDK